jgi:Domain of unknown function (DUF4276)
MSDRIGIVVDGAGDYASLRTRLKGYVIVKTDGPRGHAAAVIEIVRKSRKQIDILRALKCTRVVVVLDFESRNAVYEDFVEDLSTAFSSTDFQMPMFVAVPNRMIENWFLADIEYLSSIKAFIRDGLRQKNYEGTHGKDKLKSCMKQGMSYSETRHGPQLFETLRFAVAAMNSQSFKHFLEVAKIAWGSPT